MNKFLCTLAFIGSLSAASVTVMTPQITTHCHMRLLEQDLGNVCGNLPFNSDFNWKSLSDAAVEQSLARLRHPSIIQMLKLWNDSEILGAKSQIILILLNQNIENFGCQKKRNHMKEMI
ncbi:MAG: hypothetical protein Q8K36_07115 [Alphaproteobacteria bacterium]|nr:hypothetical protein [Alphaproteobacteria bacterium]